ncbi:hypothetical protein PEC302110_31280 [Pectobacterium araliae]|uniref:Uncharacterized protein n=1 Tax=Pectobacterium araliae TaxID=3073862 RepID=A0AAN0KC52_9GAMM|nr:hypothetical protein PEC302110_31280 [Pectobacterium sp. MAFF 302110]
MPTSLGETSARLNFLFFLIPISLRNDDFILAVHPNKDAQKSQRTYTPVKVTKIKTKRILNPIKQKQPILNTIKIYIKRIKNQYAHRFKRSLFFNQ